MRSSKITITRDFSQHIQDLKRLRIYFLYIIHSVSEYFIRCYISILLEISSYLNEGTVINLLRGKQVLTWNKTAERSGQFMP